MKWSHFSLGKGGLCCNTRRLRWKKTEFEFELLYFSWPFHMAGLALIPIFTIWLLDKGFISIVMLSNLVSQTDRGAAAQLWLLHWSLLKWLRYTADISCIKISGSISCWLSTLLKRAGLENYVCRQLTLDCSLIRQHYMKIKKMWSSTLFQALRWCKGTFPSATNHHDIMCYM